MRHALLVLILALAVVPVANDACCDLDQPAPRIVVPAQTASADPACPLHSHSGPGSTTPRKQPAAPARCTHDLSIDRAGIVKTAATPAPHLTAATLIVPAPALVPTFTTISPIAPPHAPPHRASRPDVLRI